MQAGRWEGVGRRRRKQRAGSTQQAAGRARAERTENICCMFVTPDVSQLDMSALNWTKFLKRSDMSVIAETPQLEMGPYVAVADAVLAL